MEALGKAGQLLGDDLVHTGVLQTHGVDHARSAFCDTGGGIAKAGVTGGSLEGERAEAVDVVELGELVAVAKRAAGGDDGVIQLNAAEGHPRVHLSHMISSLQSTGPSLQMRLLPVTVLQEHPMQAPKPQPMRSSKLNWPPVSVARYTALSIGSGPQV